MQTQLAVLDQWLGLHQPGVNAAERIDNFQAAWQRTSEKTARGDGPRPSAGKFANLGGAVGQRPGEAEYQKLQQIANLEKTASPDLLTGLQDTISRAKAQMADIEKAWSFSSPNPLPLPYDLLPVIQELVNRPTPLYNRIPTGEANGTAHHYFQINGYSNTGMAGVANLQAGIDSDSVSNAFGPINLRRGPQIGYATSQGSVLMIEHSLSDQVGYGVQFAMEPLGNARQISHTSLTYASLLAAEREHLYGRGNQSGFSGALSAPTGVTLAAAAAGAGQTGNTADIANLYVYVCANSGAPGTSDSVNSTVESTTALAATTGDIVKVSFTGSAGALGYDVFCGTSTGIANAYYAGSTSFAGSDAFVINFTGGGTGGCPNSGAQPPASDASATAYSYDGLLTVQSGANGGYYEQLNAALNTSNPGSEIQNGFAALYGQGTNQRLADPDEIFTTSSIRRTLSDLFKTSTSTNYRYTAQINENGVVVGGLVTGVQNESSGRDTVPITVHPFMPQGNILLQSFHLPMPDSRIANPVEFRLVQPFMLIDWSNIQLSYDASTYWFGSLVHYAPQWSGLISSIDN